MEPLWVTVIVYGMGIGIPMIFILFAAWMLIGTWRLMSRAQEVSALVVEAGKHLQVGGDDHGSIDYRPVYEYTAPDGRIVRAKAFSSERRPPPVGGRRFVLVDPAKPEIVRLSGVPGYLFGVFGLAVGGAALIAILPNL